MRGCDSTVRRPPMPEICAGWAIGTGSRCWCWTGHNRCRRWPCCLRSRGTPSSNGSAGTERRPPRWFESEIEAITASVHFGDQADEIRAEFPRRFSGLASARRANAAWLEAHFRSVGRALHRFNQALAPLDTSMRPTPFARARLEGRKSETMRCWSTEPRAVVLTGPAGRSGGRGDEGHGKSWAAVQAWLGFEDGPGRPRPMLLSS